MTILPALLPEIFLFASSCFLLFIKRKNFPALLCILASFTFLVAGYSETIIKGRALHNMIFFSAFSQNLKIIILFLCFVFCLQLTSIRQRYDNQFVVFVLFAVLGMMLVVSSFNLLALYIAIELQSIPLYVLSAIDKRSVKSSEAGVKYFSLGIFASAIMVYGISVIYSVTGSLNFSNVFVVYNGLHFVGLLLFCSALLFKLAIIPLHAWIPDVYEGSPSVSAAFFGALPKISIAGVIAIIFSGGYAIDYVKDLANNNLFVFQAQRALIFLGCISLFFGAFAAIKQTNLKRFIAFASIVHSGYILLGLCVSQELSIKNSGILYAILYSFTNIGLFSFVLLLKNHNIYSLSGLGRQDKFIGAALCTLLLSSAGLPPFAGFFTKIYVIKNLLDAQYFIAAILSVFAGVLSAFYYLRIIKVMYFDNAQNIIELQENKILIFLTILTAVIVTFAFAMLVF